MYQVASCRDVSVGLLVSIALLVLLLPQVCTGQSCTFPDYLLQQSRWETNLSLERRVIGAFWSFTSQTAETTDLLSTSSDNKRNYTCSVQLDAGKYIVSTLLTDNFVSFRCIQFIQRSSNVVQLKVSNFSDNNSPLLCGDTNLTLDINPLVSPQLVAPSLSPPSLIGGFEFTLTVHPLVSNGSSGVGSFNLCLTSDVLPLWEADCSTGGGINIDFRLYQCRSYLSMQITQQLFSLGSWTQGAYIFAIVTDMDAFWPHHWMLRFLAVPSNPDRFDLDIFTSIIAVEDPPFPTMTSQYAYYTLHMVRASFSSVCQDEAQTCRTCSGSMADVQCLDSCKACSPTTSNTVVPLTCSFSTQSQGDWIQVSYSGVETVNITSTGSLLYGTDPPRTCVPTNTNVYFPGQDVWTVSSLSTNGCRPRYSCVKFAAQGPSVLQVALSLVTVWPQPLPLDPTQICATSLFTDQPTTSTTPQSELHPTRWRTLVRDTGSSTSSLLPSVSCGLTGQSPLQLLVYTVMGVNCTVTITTDKTDPTSFDYSPSTLCSPNSLTPPTPWTQYCIASYIDPTNNNQVIITRPSSTTPDPSMMTAGGAEADYLCWLFHKNAWEPSARLYLTRAADCHAEVANDIMYRGFMGYLAQFDIVPDSNSSVSPTPGFVSVSTAAPAQDIIESPPIVKASNNGGKDGCACISSGGINVIVMLILSVVSILVITTNHN